MKNEKKRYEKRKKTKKNDMKNEKKRYEKRKKATF